MSDTFQYQEPRARVPRADGGGNEDPIFPDIEVPTEDSYLVLIGTNRYVSRYINNGAVVLRGDTIFATESMAALLLRSMYIDRRINEPKPYWRLATEEEVVIYERDKDSSDPSTAGRSVLARKAREESVDAGHASFDTETQEATDRAIKDTRTPRKRKRSSKKD